MGLNRLQKDFKSHWSYFSGLGGRCVNFHWYKVIDIYIKPKHHTPYSWEKILIHTVVILLSSNQGCFYSFNSCPTCIWVVFSCSCQLSDWCVCVLKWLQSDSQDSLQIDCYAHLYSRSCWGLRTWHFSTTTTATWLVGFHPATKIEPLKYVPKI